MKPLDDDKPETVEARMRTGLANARRAPKGNSNTSKAKPRESYSK
jgi:hypothetical protein